MSLLRVVSLLLGVLHFWLAVLWQVQFGLLGQVMRFLSMVMAAIVVNSFVLHWDWHVLFFLDWVWHFLRDGEFHFLVNRDWAVNFDLNRVGDGLFNCLRD